jgi:hypothetical protein
MRSANLVWPIDGHFTPAASPIRNTAAGVQPARDGLRNTARDLRFDGRGQLRVSAWALAGLAGKLELGLIRSRRQFFHAASASRSAKFCENRALVLSPTCRPDDPDSPDLSESHLTSLAPSPKRQVAVMTVQVGAALSLLVIRWVGSTPGASTILLANQARNDAVACCPTDQRRA